MSMEADVLTELLDLMGINPGFKFDYRTERGRQWVESRRDAEIEAIAAREQNDKLTEELRRARRDIEDLEKRSDRLAEQVREYERKT